jgi:hypothetical protein
LHIVQEYVQYLHTLGFVQLEIKVLAAKRGPKSALKQRSDAVGEERVRRMSQPSGRLSSSATSTSSTGHSNQHTEANVLYFHKGHQGLCR